MPKRIGRPPTPTLVRFYQKVRKAESGCWIWTGAKDRFGYGFLKGAGAKQERAHRIAYMEFVGPIPEGMFVCHKCDNKSCVNPEHLFLGTHQENMDDMVRKGRSPKMAGEKNGFSKLTKDQVLAIRKIEGQSCTKIAKRFGVTEMAVWKIRARRLWAHVA